VTVRPRDLARRRLFRGPSPTITFGITIDHFVTAITAGGARRSAGFSPLRIPTSPLYGVVFDLRYSFFLFDRIVIAVTDSLSVPP
jgi:hypothetical protein